MSQHRPASPTLSVSAYSEITTSSDYEIVDTASWSDTDFSESESDAPISRINSAENTNLAGLGLYQWNVDDEERASQRVVEAVPVAIVQNVSIEDDLEGSGNLEDSIRDAIDPVATTIVNGGDEDEEEEDHLGTASNYLVFPDPLHSSASSLGSIRDGDNIVPDGSSTAEFTDMSAAYPPESHALRIVLCGAKPKHDIRNQVVNDILKMLGKKVDPTLDRVNVFRIVNNDNNERIFEFRYRRSVTEKILSLSVLHRFRSPTEESLRMDSTPPTLVVVFLSPMFKVEPANMPQFSHSLSSNHIYLPLVLPVATPIKSIHTSKPQPDFLAFNVSPETPDLTFWDDPRTVSTQYHQPRTQLTELGLGTSTNDDLILLGEEGGVMNLTMLESSRAEQIIMDKLRERGIWTFESLPPTPDAVEPTDIFSAEVEDEAPIVVDALLPAVLAPVIEVDEVASITDDCDEPDTDMLEGEEEFSDCEDPSEEVIVVEPKVVKDNPVAVFVEDVKPEAAEPVRTQDVVPITVTTAAPIKLIPHEHAFLTKRGTRWLSKRDVKSFLLSGLVWGIVFGFLSSGSSVKSVLSCLSTMIDNPGNVTGCLYERIMLLGSGSVLPPAPVPVKEGPSPVHEPTVQAPAAPPAPTPPPMIGPSPPRLGLEAPPPKPNSALAKFSSSMLAVEPYHHHYEDDDESLEEEHALDVDILSSLVYRHQVARNNARKLKRAMAKLWASGK